MTRPARRSVGISSVDVEGPAGFSRLLNLSHQYSEQKVRREWQNGPGHRRRHAWRGLDGSGKLFALSASRSSDLGVALDQSKPGLPTTRNENGKDSQVGTTRAMYICAAGRELVRPFLGGVWVHLDAGGDGNPVTRLFWLPEFDPAVVTLDAESVPPSDPDAFDIADLPHLADLVLDGHGHELLLLDDGVHQIEFQVRSGTLAKGPVRLSCDLNLFAGLGAKLQTLTRLNAVRRLGRFPKALFPAEHGAAKWAMALQAYDGMLAGASLRDIASVLFTEQLVRDEWTGRSGFLKARIQRLLRYGRKMVDGNYKSLLQ